MDKNVYLDNTEESFSTTAEVGTDVKEHCFNSSPDRGRWKPDASAMPQGPYGETTPAIDSGH